MRYIPLLDHTPSDDWLLRAEEAYNELMTIEPENREDFINKNDRIWRDLRDFLSNISYGKCWYSETKDVFQYYHVDHFRPKNRVDDRVDFTQPVHYSPGYWWLAFDYTNYRLAGAVGNTTKRDKFAVIRNKANSPDDPIEDELAYLLDPISEYDVELLTFDESGAILPVDPDLNSIDHKRAKYTIEVLKLESHYPLKEARKELWEYCNRLLHDIAVLKVQQKHNPSASRRARIEEKMNRLRELRDPSKEFTMTVEACIEAFKSSNR